MLKDRNSLWIAEELCRDDRRRHPIPNGIRDNSGSNEAMHCAGRRLERRLASRQVQALTLRWHAISELPPHPLASAKGLCVWAYRLTRVELSFCRNSSAQRELQHF
jgi:hypothetical protein